MSGIRGWRRAGGARELKMHRIGAFVAAAIAWWLLGAGAAAAQSTEQCPWLDASKPAEQRAEQLLAAMTLDEKATLTYGQLSRYGFASEIPANDRLCMPAFVQSDGPAGIAGGFTGTQVGVTAYPVGLSQASVWDPALQRRLGDSMAQEALGKGANVLLAPATNINRVPMNGRNFEYFGEDPFLSGKTAVAEVRGIQSNPVVATAKHYAVNNQETNRNTISAEVDERAQREIYLPAFEAAVKDGDVGSLMCAYNKVNGTHVCEHRGLLTNVLRDDWGFDGFVMSDWGATHSTEASAIAGLDQDHFVPTGQYFGPPLKAAVEAGKVPAARLDEMVLRILRTYFRLGLFDRRPAAQPAAFGSNVSTPARQKVATEVAEQGSVLLKNADNLLPLDRVGPGTRIAVIGRPGAQPGASLAAVGAGSAHTNAIAVDPLTAIQTRAATQQALVTYSEGDSAADAAAAAAAADIAVVFTRDLASEGNDRPSLKINDGACAVIFCQQAPTDQDAMVAAAADANPNTIVVMLTGGPVEMPWLDKVKGVLEMWYPGYGYGNAVAALLFGDTNPSGKLPQTFPKVAGDLPTRTPEQYPGKDGKVRYSEGLQVGYRWFDAQGIKPLFEFGFGLSYTTFAVGGLRISPADDGVTGARVRFDVTNTGGRAGAEVAQVYIGFPRSSGEPPKQLKGFGKVFLGSGERETLTVPLDERAFSYWDVRAHAWRVDPGCYEVMVGRSSRDIAERVIVALGDARCDGKAATIDVPVRAPEAASLVALPSARPCLSGSFVTVGLRDPRGRERLRSVTVRLNGRTRSKVTGRRLRTMLRRHGGIRVDLRGRRGDVRVEVIARTTRRRTIRRSRTYRVCVPGRGCASRRDFIVRLPRGVVSARVTYAGKRAQIIPGRRLRARLDLRNLPRRRLVVRLVGRTRSGRVVRGTRVFRPCAKRKQMGTGEW